MVLLLHPTVAFLQIQNKDNENIVLLAPPCPWRQRKAFAAATAIIICSNGSRCAMIGERGNRSDTGPNLTNKHTFSTTISSQKPGIVLKS